MFCLFFSTGVSVRAMPLKMVWGRGIALTGKQRKVEVSRDNGLFCPFKVCCNGVTEELHRLWQNKKVYEEAKKGHFEGVENVLPKNGQQF